MENQNTVVWNDRKRIFGLPLSFTKYSIKNNRLYLSKGLFSTEENEILLYRILDIKINRSIVDKIFGVGTITLYTCDKTHKELQLINIKNPNQIRDMISEMVEKERERASIKGREIYGIADSNNIDN